MEVKHQQRECHLGMRNLTGNPIFSDLNWFYPGPLVSRPLVKGNEDSGLYVGFLLVSHRAEREWNLCLAV